MSRHLRIGALTAAVMAALVLPGMPAADGLAPKRCERVPIVGPDGFIIGWKCKSSSTGDGGGGDGKPADPDDQAAADALDELCAAIVAAGEPAPPECQVAAQGVAADVWANYKPPKPAVRTAPPIGSDAAVGLPTWVWVEPEQWEPQTVTRTANGITVTITATPVQILLRPGEGLPQLECEGPATPYDAGIDAAAQKPSCSYTYKRSSAGLPGSAYQMEVAVVWSGTWTGPGGTSGAFDGTVESATEFDLRVAEGQALN